MNGLLINYEYCSGCRSCELACKNAHDIPLGAWPRASCPHVSTTARRMSWNTALWKSLRSEPRD